MKFLFSVQCDVSQVSAANELDIDLVTRREIPYPCAPMLHSLFICLGVFFRVSLVQNAKMVVVNLRHVSLYTLIVVKSFVMSRERDSAVFAEVVTQETCAKLLVNGCFRVNVDSVSRRTR